MASTLTRWIASQGESGPEISTCASTRPGSTSGHRCASRRAMPGARSIIPAGKAGYCRVRTYDGQTLRSPYLGKFCSMAVDPIEKKPLHRAGAPAA